MEPSDAREGTTQHADPETPACQSCRSRKLRCSRETPSCNRCTRLGIDCRYDYTRNKPGVKVGIIQTLTQRVETLEAQLEAVRDQQQLTGSVLSPSNLGYDANAIKDLVSSFMEEWRDSHPLPNQRHRQTIDDTMAVADSPQPRDPAVTTPDHQPPHKRRCPEPTGREYSASSAQLPPDDLINAIIDAYFSVVHPFIPIIHEPLFRSRLRDPTERPKLIIVLHAMMVCALRYVAHERLAGEWLGLYPDALQRSRDYVILAGMDDLSVENVQALIMVAFVHVGDGNANKAWPIIGTLSRAVVYLGLHKEPEEDYLGELCLKPLRYLPQPRVWTEAEERRRVFWNVFLLDRFCSTITGWNVNLSSEDVQVRLPSDGLYWAKEEPVTTPFFNIWDASMAKLGKSVSFLPSHFSSLADPDREAAATAPTSERVSPVAQALKGPTVDVSTIGSFAYCIEATESLNRVVKFFLQRPVNFESKHQFSSWLTRFKELDLQLIHWKMFLPRRWKDSNISKEPAFVHMDPNLTLAHITHNTSMILLHQSIAYPHVKILDKLNSASSGSAETCQLAASETANIVQKYLQYTPFVGLVNAQFAFCAFISARVMIVHSHIHHTPIPESYKILLSSLQQMSDRWISMSPGFQLNPGSTNFSEGLLLQLQALQERCRSSSFNIAALGYVAEVNCALGLQAPVSSFGESQWIEERRAQQRHSIIPVTERQSHYISTSRLRRGSNQSSPISHPLHTPSSGSLQNARIRGELHPSIPSPGGLSAPRTHGGADMVFNDLFPANHPPPHLTDNLDSFAQLSNVLLDPQYMDMDRIISFQDSFMR